MKTVRTLDEAEQAIKARVPFRLRSGTTLWAVTEPPEETGLLPANRMQGLRRAVYVVISYSTPIAWIEDSGDIFLPDVGYSLSTGQHQLLTAHALGVSFSPGPRRPFVPPPRLETQYGRPRRLRSGGIDGSGDQWYSSDDAMSVHFS